jgi:predicted transcriptional regulator
LEIDSTKEVKFDWIVDNELEYLEVIVDPFNEITESVENNNHVSLKNPLFGPVIAVDDQQKKEDKKDTSVENEDTIIDVEDDPVVDQGGTIWKGPEENVEQEIPYLPAIDYGTDNYPPGNDDEKEIIPFIVPSVVVSVSLILLAGFMAIFRMEPVRYRWALMLIPLYSKLKKSNIEKGVRYEILGYIKAKPGSNYSELKQNLDLNDGSLVHHLRILEREEKIYAKKMGKYKLFYASSYRRNPVMDDYISPFHQRIIQIISENPGIVPKKLSAILDRSQTDMSYHLSELSRNGYLEKIKKGRNIHYYVNKNSGSASS